MTPLRDDGIVVVGVGEDDEMQVNAVPAALSEHLGPDATGGLLQVLNLERRAWSEDVLSVSAERFERRLAESASSLRVQIAQTEAALRQEIGQVEVRLRQEIAQVEARLQQEIGQVELRLRQELAQMEVRILREIANGRVDLLKWSFVFWIGQVVAVSAVMGAMLRIVR